MKLRPMRRADVPAAAKIISKNYNVAFGRSAKKELLSMFALGPIKPYYLVAEEAGTVVGLGGFIQSWMDYSVYEIFWINVKKNYQGRGIGKAIVRRLIRIIQRRNPALILLSTLDPEFYAAFGFKKLKHQPVDSGYALMQLGLRQ